MARAVTHRILIEAEGTAVYQRAPHARSVRFPDAKTAMEYTNASGSGVVWYVPILAIMGLLRLANADLGVMLGVLFGSVLLVVTVSTLRLHFRFRGRCKKLSWEETARLDPHAARVPLRDPAHPLKQAATTLLCLSLGGTIAAFVDFDRVVRRDGELVALGIATLALVCLLGGVFFGGKLANHIRFWWMTRGYP
ncbi:MAG: hypothetical protein AAGF12_14955 [Myxococcota bacterium]